VTDETRAELRRGVEAVVRTALHYNRIIVYSPEGVNGDHPTVIARIPYAGSVGDTPPLTPAQQLAISVLLGEPDTVVASALADMLLDQGHEYATAIKTKTVAECAAFVSGWAENHGERPDDTNRAIARALRNMAEGLVNRFAVAQPPSP
jgi:hypothetical protein